MKYIVCTPIYDRIPDMYYEPGEPGCDVVEVEAETKREALVKGLRLLRQQRSQWVNDQQSDGRSPFNGLQTELLEGEEIL